MKQQQLSLSRAERAKTIATMKNQRERMVRDINNAAHNAIQACAGLVEASQPHGRTSQAEVQPSPTGRHTVA